MASYEVLKDFEDKEHRIVNADGDKEPLSKSVGDTFIPAETHYPQFKVDALLKDGKLKLIEEPEQEEDESEPEEPEEPELPADKSTEGALQTATEDEA